MASIDLRQKFGPIENQGSPNACVAHAVTSTVEAIFGVQDLSRLFVYYNARSLAGQAGTDAGCQPRNAVKGFATFGAPSETLWAYDTSKLTVKPSTAAYSAGLAIKSRVKSYQSITSLSAMKSALSMGLPVVFCFMVPDIFMSETKVSGILNLPSAQAKYLGGHCVVAIGFDDIKGTILVRNSFGTGFGNDGYFVMPYEWFNNFGSRVSDAWTFVPKT